MSITQASKPPIATPEEYLLLQPIDRQSALRQLRETILLHLPAGFSETMQYGMISYVVPHSIFPEGYHVNPKDPLPFLSLANQKRYIAVYHLGLYADGDLLRWFREAYANLNIGKLDMGKSCIRFPNPKKIPFALIGELCKKMDVSVYLSLYRLSRAESPHPLH